jgi:phage-related protein
MVDTSPDPKRLIWMGSSRRDFSGFPEKVRGEMGYALYVAQCGGRHRRAKTLKGFGGAGIVEIVQEHDGDAYRTVYVVRFASALYVLHAFQKKSKSGIKTPANDMSLVTRRLKDAEELERQQAT